MGGICSPQQRKKKFMNTTSPQEKSMKHRHHNTYFHRLSQSRFRQLTCGKSGIFSARTHSSTVKIILLYFKQNKHITTLFIAHVSILLMPVNQFSCSCKETLRKESRQRKKEKSLERWTLSSFTFLTFLGVNPTDWSPILTQSIAFQSQLWHSLLVQIIV